MISSNSILSSDVYFLTTSNPFSIPLWGQRQKHAAANKS